jgi:hypothetical protein
LIPLTLGLEGTFAPGVQPALTMKPSFQEEVSAMCYKLIGKCLLLSGLVLSLTVALGATTKKCPLPGPVTPESYTWDFPNEASQTLADFENEAGMIRTHVTMLQSFTRFPALVSPESHARELMIIRERVNRLGERLCRLMEIQHVTDLWQQSAIRNVRASLTGLVDSTEAAILFINEAHNPAQLASTEYGAHLDGMYENADLLCHCVVESQLEYAIENED